MNDINITHIVLSHHSPIQKKKIYAYKSTHNPPYMFQMQLCHAGHSICSNLSTEFVLNKIKLAV